MSELRYVAIVPILFAAMLVLGYKPYTPKPDDSVHREKIEWSDIWVSDADNGGVARILFIGDSIARGYYDSAAQALAGRASAARFTTSRSVCDPAFFDELGVLLDQYRFNVIVFNNGLHGWDYPEERYEAGIVRLVELLKAEGKGAKLAWVNSTPVKSDSGMGDKGDRVNGRNAIAAAIMAEHEIPVIDLHGLAQERTEYLGDDGVHFSAEGRQAQGERIAAEAGALL